MLRGAAYSVEELRSGADLFFANCWQVLVRFRLFLHRSLQLSERLTTRFTRYTYICTAQTSNFSKMLRWAAWVAEQPSVGLLAPGTLPTLRT